MFVKRRKGGKRECSSVGTGRRKREGRREGRAEQGGGLGLMGEVLEGRGAALEAVASHTGSPKGTFGQTRKVEEWGCFRQA